MSIFVVGDSDQSLYRFAGANPTILTSGIDQSYPNIRTIKLAVNYRSTRSIIAACSRMIARNYDAQGGPYPEAFRKDTQARPSAPEGEPVTFSMFADVFEESDAVASAIAQQIEGGHAPQEFFVGARTRAQLGYLEGYLVRRKVPFINIAGGSFWENRHIAAIVGYVRLAFDQGDSEAFCKVYNVASNWNTYQWGEKKGQYCTHRYLGQAFLDACKDRDTGKPEYKWIYRAVGQRRSYGAGVDDLEMFLQEVKLALSDAQNAGDVVQFVIDHCYKKYLMIEEGITDQENSRLDDLDTLVDVASQFEDVGEFIGYVKGMIEAARAAKDKDWSKYVVLSTVHRLKGLEREIVYGVGLCETVEDDGPNAAGLLPHTFSKKEPPQMGVLPSGGKSSIEDERCIAFVLASRAKDEVHLSGCEAYRKSMMSQSRFIEEMEL